MSTWESLPLGLRMQVQAARKKELHKAKIGSLVARVQAAVQAKPGMSFPELVTELGGWHEKRKIRAATLSDMINNGRVPGITYRTQSGTRRLYVRDELPAEGTT
jgi:hypothetical protein